MDGDADAARDAWIDMVAGVSDPAGFAVSRWPDARPRVTAPALALLEAQRWRLAMFASDGWFWDDPIRPETRQILRAAARAVRLADEVGGTRLERPLLQELPGLRAPPPGPA